MVSMFKSMSAIPTKSFTSCTKFQTHQTTCKLHLAVLCCIAYVGCSMLELPSFSFSNKLLFIL